MYVTKHHLFACVCEQLIGWLAGGSGLDMPSVHFFCNHSFHQVFPYFDISDVWFPPSFKFFLQRCLGDSDKVCPVCERTNRKVTKKPLRFCSLALCAFHY